MFFKVMEQKFTQFQRVDSDPISKTEAYIFFFMKNPMYKEMFFGCLDHQRKGVLLTLMSRSKCEISWPNFRFALLYYFVLFWQHSLEELYYTMHGPLKNIFLPFQKIFILLNKYVKHEILYSTLRNLHSLIFSYYILNFESKQQATTLFTWS